MWGLETNTSTMHILAELSGVDCDRVRALQVVKYPAPVTPEAEEVKGASGDGQKTPAPLMHSVYTGAKAVRRYMLP